MAILEGGPLMPALPPKGADAYLRTNLRSHPYPSLETRGSSLQPDPKGGAIAPVEKARADIDDASKALGRAQRILDDVRGEGPT